MSDRTAERGVPNIDRHMGRRRLLSASAIVAASLAGCVGDDDPDDIELADDVDTPADTEPTDDVPDDERIDQAFIAPTWDNPEEGSILVDHSSGLWSDVDTVYSHAGQVHRIVNESATFGEFVDAGYWVDDHPYPLEDSHYHLGTWVESIEIEPSAYVITIRDDAYFSDGEEITAYDFAIPPLSRRLPGWPDAGMWLNPPEETLRAREYDTWDFPDGPDGKVLEIGTVHEGNIGRLVEENPETVSFAYGRIFNAAPWPTHVSPWDEVAERVLEEVEKGLDAGIGGQAVGDPQEFGPEYLDESTFEKFRDPDSLVTSGLWKLEEIRGAEEWVLTPNEHHRLADEVNFTEIRLPWIEDETREVAELQANRLDFAQQNLPEDVGAQLEQDYEEVLRPDPDDGFVLKFDHSHPVFGDPRVRQAMSFAIDTEPIAEAFHADLTFPVHTQMGDMYGIERWLPGDWLEDNLITYEQDLDRADELMLEAGLERVDGVWTHEGEPVEEILPTFEEAPIAEPMVADQLSEFGINLTIETMGPDIYEERWADGEFSIFPQDPWRPYWVGNFMRDVYSHVNFPVRTQGQATAFRMYGTDDDELYETVHEHLETMSWQGMTADENLRDELYVEMPPIGEPDAEPERWYIFDDMLTEFYDYLGDEQSRQEWMKKATWWNNWSLPVIQIFFMKQQSWINSTNWVWDRDHELWDNHLFEAIGIHLMLPQNIVSADPENPK